MEDHWGFYTLRIIWSILLGHGAACGTVDWYWCYSWKYTRDSGVPVQAAGTVSFLACRPALHVLTVLPACSSVLSYRDFRQCLTLPHSLPDLQKSCVRFKLKKEQASSVPPGLITLPLYQRGKVMHNSNFQQEWEEALASDWTRKFRHNTRRSDRQGKKPLKHPSAVSFLW